MSVKAILIAGALMLLVFAGFAAATWEKAPASPIQLYTSRGKLFDSNEHAGKVIVVDFFATWCPPCRAALPSLQRLHETYQDRGVVVISVQTSDPESPDELTRASGVKYPVLVQGDAVAKAYGVRGLPTLVVIGPDGVETHRSSGWGPRSEQEIAAAIEAALAR